MIVRFDKDHFYFDRPEADIDQGLLTPVPQGSTTPDQPDKNAGLAGDELMQELFGSFGDGGQMPDLGTGLKGLGTPQGSTPDDVINGRLPGAADPDAAPDLSGVDGSMVSTGGGNSTSNSNKNPPKPVTTVNDDGSKTTVYPDGRTVTVSKDGKETSTTYPDGTFVKTNSDTKTTFIETQKARDAKASGKPYDYEQIDITDPQDSTKVTKTFYIYSVGKEDRDQGLLKDIVLIGPLDVKKAKVDNPYEDDQPEMTSQQVEDALWELMNGSNPLMRTFGESEDDQSGDPLDTANGLSDPFKLHDPDKTKNETELPSDYDPYTLADPLIQPTNPGDDLFS
ncbi:MAG: T-complex 10 C-terminal domain-containing protein [Pseudomonadota bacterium]